MAVQALTLEGLTSAEFQKAEGFFRGAARTQLALLLVAAVSIFVTAETPTLLLGISTALLFALWAWLDWNYRACRGQAERGRRMLLIVEGLGNNVSLEEQRDVEEGFSITATEGQAAQNPNFFASNRAPGNERLVELIEESAFYSCRLYRFSAGYSWRRLSLFSVICLALLLSSITFASSSDLANGARLFCVIAVFLISQEILGNGRDYNEAYKALSAMQGRIRALKRGGYPEADLLVLMADYNSSVEGAPMMAPGIYKRNAANLDDLWRRHQQTN